jgi:acetyl-CoA hydrolase
VVRLNGPVTIARSDAVIVVTEYGVADLRGTTLTQRVAKLLDIAHPEHRAALQAQLDNG